MYDWQCCESKEGIKDSYTQIYQIKNCILKAKKALKWVQGKLLKAIEGWLWSTPKLWQPNLVCLMRERRSENDLNGMDACSRWSIEAIHLVFLYTKSISSIGNDWEGVWEVWIYGKRNHNTGQQIGISVPKTKLSELKKYWGTKKKINW